MSNKPHARRPLRVAILAIGIAGLIAAGAISRDRWAPLLSRHQETGQHMPHSLSSGEEHEDDHEHEHDHDHSGEEDEAATIHLSERALANIGFQPFVVQPQNYSRQLTLPAIVIERPGRSQIHITAPLTGNVAKIFAVTGEAVAPGDPLFEVRLTHEELVKAQRDLLETIAKLEIAHKEIARLKAVGGGVIPGKRILDQEYEERRLQVALKAAQQAMLLHGLTEEQVQEVRTSGHLFQTTTIRAPAHDDVDETCNASHLFTVQQLGVAQGEHVDMGREMAMLADHCELQIEALAFEDDAGEIRRAAQADRPLTATRLDAESPAGELRDLKVMYVAGQIDPNSRAFKVYVPLPNRIALDKTTPTGKRFLEWAYKPGQRMQLRIPIETWHEQVVLPTSAVVDDGAEAYVFRQHGDHFEQTSVHVLYRDQNGVVIEGDGALVEGDVIAGQGAYQMHLALKNKSGAAIDPHAGHHH